jgi:hypothetical protein
LRLVGNLRPLPRKLHALGGQTAGVSTDPHLQLALNGFPPRLQFTQPVLDLLQLRIEVVGIWTKGDQILKLDTGIQSLDGLAAVRTSLYGYGMILEIGSSRISVAPASESAGISTLIPLFSTTDSTA